MTEFPGVRIRKQYCRQLTVYDLSAWGRDTVFKNDTRGRFGFVSGEVAKRKPAWED